MVRRSKRDGDIATGGTFLSTIVLDESYLDQLSSMNVSTSGVDVSLKTCLGETFA